jgi:glycosyltransferase involved in cell wall biosynthesis
MKVNLMLRAFREFSSFMRLKNLLVFYKYKRYFDATYYLSTNPDVASSKISALHHFVKFGEKEGRSPVPWFFKDIHGPESSLSRGYQRPFLRFLNSDMSLPPHPLIDSIKWKNVMHKFGKKERLEILRRLTYTEFIKLTKDWWDSSDYLKQNPDIATTGFPEHHLAMIGARDRRVLSPGVRISKKTDLTRTELKDLSTRGPVIEKFYIFGTEYVVFKISPPDRVLQQVFELESIDPMVLAPTIELISSLPTYIADDLERRDSINVIDLDNLASNDIEALVLVDGLEIGGGVKYALDLSMALASKLKTTIFATNVGRDLLGSQIEMWGRRFNSLPPCVAFDDLTLSSKNKDFILALFVQRVKPKILIVINSDLGYRTVRRFGLGISSFTTVYSCFFSQSPRISGRPHSARFLESSLQFGCVISDNHRFFDEQRHRFLNDDLGKLIVIPPTVSIAPKTQFEEGLLKREKPRNRHEPVRAFWVGRWDIYKDIELVELLATEMPELMIDVIHTGGLLDSGIMGLDNVRIIPGDTDWMSMDFTGYDFYLFTSMFEGVPNTPLEVAGLGVPLVVADVGGLRESFDDKSIWFYSIDGSLVDRLNSLKETVNRVLSASWQTTEEAIRAARLVVETRHNAKSFGANVYSLLVKDAITRGTNER